MSLARSALVVGAASIASRILGFARDVLFAGVLGAGPVADAFLAAFRLPNVLRRILGEGGLNPALIPALARLPLEDRPRFAGEAFSGLALALFGATLVVELLAAPVMLILAPGLSGDVETLALGTLYTRLAFPLVIGVTLASYLAAILNHDRRFAAAALAPLAVNAALVGVLLVLELGTSLEPKDRASWLAAAASLAGFAQLGLIGLAFVRRRGSIRWAWPRRSVALGKLVAGAGPALIAGGASQIFILAGTQVASLQPSGLSWLHYADRVAQLPLGVVAAMAGIVLLPELAAREGKQGRGAMLAAQNEALRLGFLVALPAAVALACLAEPIAAMLFERGAFGPEDSRGTAAALAGLSLGLPFAAAGKVLSQTLFVRGAAREMLGAVVVGLVATVAAAFLLGQALGILGVALGVSLGCLAHAIALALTLRRLDGFALDARLLGRLVRTLLAGALLGVALVAARTALAPSAWGLALLCLGGLAFYGAAAWTVGALTRADLALLSKKA